MIRYQSDKTKVKKRRNKKWYNSIINIQMTIRNCYTSDKNISNKKNNRDWKTRYISFHFSLCFYYMLFPFIYIYHKWLILIVQKHDVIENNRQRTIDEQQTMIDRGIFMDCIHTLLTILSQESNFNSTSIRYLVIVLSINSPTNSFLDFLGKTVSLWRFSLNLCHSLVTKSAFFSFFIFFFYQDIVLQSNVSKLLDTRTGDQPQFPRSTYKISFRYGRYGEFIV